MKGVSQMSLYNMLNDLRHLSIIDLREYEAFLEHQIRGSVSIFDKPQKIAEYLDAQTHLSKKNEEKYNIKKVRRLIFIHHNPVSFQKKKELVQQLVESLKLNEYKIYFLDSEFRIFQKEYPFLVISKQIIQNYESAQQNEDQRKILFAHSLFPSCLVDRKIYLGSVFNANSKVQLDALGIKSLLDLKFYENETDIDEWKKTDFNYRNVPIPYESDHIVDFNQVAEIIEELNTPILIFCPDGYQVTSCIAIGYLMSSQELKYDIATLKVFQLRGNTSVQKSTYAQIMQYNPQVKVIQVI